MNTKDIVTELCHQHGIGVPELEKRVGLAKSTVTKWATSSPNMSSLIKVADYFGVSVDSILGRDITTEEQPRNEHEAAVLARYNSLSAENRALIDELMEKLKSQK